MMEDLEPEIIKGFFSKRGSTFLRGWKKRFFVFEKGVMSYYGNYPYDESNVKKVVDLQVYEIQVKAHNIIYLSPSLDTGNYHGKIRDYLLVSSDPNVTTDDLVTLIRSHIEYAKMNNRNSSRRA